MTIPKKWRDQFPNALIEPQTIGESGADVFRLLRDNGEDLFLKSEPIGPHAELPDEIDDVVAIGSPVIWVQLGIWNQEAAEYGESKGLTVVMDRCIKIEHARFNGGLHLLGFDTGQITARKTIR